MTQAGTGQLEENKNNFTRELEGIKNELAKSLERERIFLTLTREEIQRRLQWISAAQKVVSDYRSAIGTISTGEAVKSERSEPIEKQLSEIRDQMDPDTSLYVPWIIFHQRGLTLRALAQEKTSSGERQKLWTERGETGQPRNLAFGSAAQKVLELLRAEHDKLVRDRDVVSTAGASA